MNGFILVACGSCGYIFSVGLSVCLALSLSSLSPASDLSVLSISHSSPPSLAHTYSFSLSSFRSLARALSLSLSPGLPAGVLISFVWVLAGLTIGWLAIGIHQYTLTNAAVKAVQVGWEWMWRTNNVERA